MFNQVAKFSLILAMGFEFQAQAFQHTHVALTQPGGGVFVKLAVETKDYSHLPQGVHERFKSVFNGAWLAPNDLVWSVVAGSMNHSDAEQFCQSLGAALPTREEFIGLRVKMGGQQASEIGFGPQLIEGLSEGRFWTSTQHSDGPHYFYMFQGQFGYFEYDWDSYDHSVLCVLH